MNFNNSIEIMDENEIYEIKIISTTLLIAVFLLVTIPQILKFRIIYGIPLGILLGIISPLIGYEVAAFIHHKPENSNN
jgi:hypothetical protein